MCSWTRLLLPGAWLSLKIYCGQICPATGTANVHDRRQRLQALVRPLGNLVWYMKISRRSLRIKPWPCVFFLFNTFYLGKETRSLKWQGAHSGCFPAAVTSMEHLPYLRKLSHPILLFYCTVCIEHEELPRLPELRAGKSLCPHSCGAKRGSCSVVTPQALSSLASDSFSFSRIIK